MSLVGDLARLGVSIVCEVGEKNSLSIQEKNSEEWLLPPFLGEMGVEIEFFLASVEPYLRSGWKIPARRPQLYP
ncbi:MAG: hypothetical protein K6347_05985, partial [Campylobacterales bacterium]